jgi:ribosomal-protein-alanine N-acetyltransferase
MTMKVRAADRDQDCFRDYALAIYDILYAVYGVASPWSFEQVFADMLLDTSHYYFAFDDEGALVGFLATSQVMDELEINNIAVLPHFQGQGSAKALLAKVMRFDGTLLLEVRESNAGARHLYEKLGFEVYHRRKDYYRNPMEDALLMRKDNHVG